MKKYLCIEDGEHFIIEAKDWEEAQESAAMYNGQVIEEMPNGYINLHGVYIHIACHRCLHIRL